jgi:hypothetical protein
VSKTPKAILADMQRTVREKNAVTKLSGSRFSPRSAPASSRW